jgi:hypothetical protein
MSTTRRAGRLALLKEHGVDHPLLDTGEVAPAVRELYPDGVDAALDLVGTPTLPDTLRAVRVHGTACFGGSSAAWSVVPSDTSWPPPAAAAKPLQPGGTRLSPVGAWSGCGPAWHAARLPSAALAAVRTSHSSSS